VEGFNVECARLRGQATPNVEGGVRVGVVCKLKGCVIVSDVCILRVRETTIVERQARTLDVVVPT
jgi:hypothetical protein